MLYSANETGKTRWVTATDGSQIAYDITGSGPDLILLHGGGTGQSRQKWRQFGYLQQLSRSFRVITLDGRGHGESAKPPDPAAYTIDQMCDDVLSVARACQADSFYLCGYSWGGNIGRFLARQSQRVAKLVVIGIPFGPAVGGDFLTFVDSFQSRWQQPVEQYLTGAFSLQTLSVEDQALWREHDIPVMLAWLTAMLEWGAVEPDELPCPTLWLSGSENEGTMASIHAYGDRLTQTQVTARVIPGLNHAQELSESAVILPLIQSFLT